MRGAGYISLCSGILSGLLFSCLLLLSFHGKSPYQQYTATTTTSDHSISQPPTTAPLGGSTRKRFISYNVLLVSSLDIVQAIKDTWARDTEHIHFYYKSKGDQSGLPKSVIKLENQPYSLLALVKHICEREQGDFFWYAIVSGSTYIKVSRLENILRSLSTSKPLMLGHIELFMQWDEPMEVYCSEMGVILNRAVLNGVCGKINQCKNDPAQISEALQLSRCIYQISNITCKEPVQSNKLFYQAQNQFDIDELQIGMYKHQYSSTHFLFYYPLTDPDHIYHFHRQTLQDELYKTLQEHTYLQHHTKDLMKSFESLHGIHDWPIGAVKSSKSHKIMNLSLTDGSWVYSYSEHFPFLSYRSRHVIDHVTSSSHSFVDIDTGAMSIESRETEKGLDVTEKRYSLLPQSVFSISKHTYMISRVNFIIAVSPLSQSFQRFMVSFETTFLSRKVSHQVSLLVVLFSNSQVTVTKRSVFAAATLIELYQRKYPHSDLRLRTTESDVTWSELLHQAVLEYSSYELLFIATTHMDFSPQFLNHCFSNTLEGQQVYFPSPFSPFNPTTYQRSRLLYPYSTKLQINPDEGVWLPPLSNIVCIFSSDLSNILNVTQSHRQIDLLDTILSLKKIKVFSSPDPGLVHLWREGCSEELLTSIKLYCDLFSYSPMCECSQQ